MSFWEIIILAEFAQLRFHCEHFIIINNKDIFGKVT